MRKTIFLAGALVAVFASCTKTVVEEPQKEILFQVANHSVATKADPADYKDNYKMSRLAPSLGTRDPILPTTS